MLNLKVPRCWKVCNDLCGGAGATLFNRGIRRPVVLKPDANELRARVQLNRCLAKVRVCGSKQCTLKRQEELRRIRNGVHVPPNGEVEGLPRSAAHVPPAHTVFRHPRRVTISRSRIPPTIVRSHVVNHGGNPQAPASANIAERRTKSRKSQLEFA
jgi:hypothetical protein